MACTPGSDSAWSHAAFANVQRLRAERGLSVDELVSAVRRLGLPMSRRVFYDISNPRSERTVGLDELLCFAVALRVSPTKLLMPRIEDCPVAVGPPGGRYRMPAETLAWWLAVPDRRPPVPPGSARCPVHVVGPSAPDPRDTDMRSLLRDVSTGADYIGAAVACDLDAAFSLAEDPSVALVTLSAAYVVTTCNHNAEVLTGRTGRDLVGRDATELLSGAPDPARGSVATPARLLGFDPAGPGYVGRARIRRPDGAEVQVALAVKPVSAPDGSVEGYSCAAHRLATREETRKGADENAVPDGWGEVCSHLDGTIYLFSHRAEDICGVRGCDVVGRAWKQIGLDPHLDEGWYEYVHDLFSRGHASWVQPFRRPDGTRPLLALRSRLQYDFEGDPDSILTLVADVSSQPDDAEAGGPARRARPVSRIP
ncbi:MAG: PAS domain-containing protein [Acidimicrobiia bacterium]|nr:PAS domain-containing protein [Acidimicrobiia bacterium]